MAAANSNSHLAHGSFTDGVPGHSLYSPDGEGKSPPDCRTGAASWMDSWKRWLIGLVFCAGLAAVVLVLEPVAWRLGQGSHSARPAPKERLALVQPSATPPQQFDIEPETGSEIGDRAALPPLLGTEGGEQTPHPGLTERAEAPPTPPEPVQPDQLFERRLRASEEDLRAGLRDIPEVRLLSDGAVQQVREAEQAAVMKLVESARAAREAARINANDANARVNALRTALNRNCRDLSLVSAKRQAASAARLVQRAFSEANRAYTQVASRSSQQREKLGYEGSLRLYRTLKQAAVRAGLPLQSGPACQLAPSTAVQVASLSKDLRDLGFVSLPGVPSTVRFSRGGVGTSGSASTGEAARAATKAFADWCDQHRLEKMSGTVPTLTQMLQIENEAKRLLLVRELTRVPGTDATKQLAVRAIADLSPAVRSAAVAGLGKRPWRQYGPVLLRGLRYPWSPVADHAAVALRTLNRPEAVAPLLAMLDLPSPSAPVLNTRTNRYTVSEVVRLNHLRNCLLCHTPSASKDDGLVRGLVPTPGERLPAAYYASQAGHFVRADRTFLRQDFSVILPNEQASPWPRQQRYDFVIRRRILPPSQVTDSAVSPCAYPQRDAVLYALRGLTGKDGGDASARWRELLGSVVSKRKGDRKSPELEASIISLTTSVRSR